MLGPWINSAALVVGGGFGAALRRWIPKRVVDALPLTCGVISASIGTVMVNRVHAIPAVVLAMLGGAFLGELLFLERGLERAITGLQRLLGKAEHAERDAASAQTFIRKFITILVLFSVSGMGIFGSMQEGITGNPTILITKAILDLFTALIFAAELGYPVILIAIPQLAIQASLYFGATLISGLFTPEMQGDFSACGGVIMLATGLRICGIKLFPIVNMLPALFLVMPISALWSHLPF